MSTEAILVEAQGSVRLLTLNRAETLNAFDDELHRAFTQALEDVARDPDAKAIVLTGAGRAFSAGGDIETFEVYARDLIARRAALRAGRRLFDDLVNIPIPVVAAVNGPAVGLGCTIVTACDMSFVSEDTYLADPHVAVALVAGDGGAVTWPLSVGLMRAKEYLLTGDRIPASDAARIGLVNRAVPADQVVAQATEWAHKVARLPWQAVQDTKTVLNQHLRQASVTALGYGLAAESQSHDTDDFRAIPEQFRNRAK